MVKVRQFRFRALIVLNPVGPGSATLNPPASQYPNRTHALMIQARPLRSAGSSRVFPAELCWNSDEPLHPGDRAEVTITVTDDEARAFFDAGQRFTLWSGCDVGHGTISPEGVHGEQPVLTPDASRRMAGSRRTLTSPRTAATARTLGRSALCRHQPDAPGRPGSSSRVGLATCGHVRKWAYAERMAQTARVVVLSSQEPPARQAAGRAPWGTISREDIVLAAVEVVTAGGYEQMTIRSLAGELGVAPMSLYRHIRNKDDLLDEVVDRLLADTWRPVAAVDDWQAWVIEAAARLRNFLVTQPAALHVYLRHPVVSPAAVERMDAMMDVLRRTGADEQTARRAYGAVHTYTIGFAALEATRARGTPDGRNAGNLARELAAYTTAGQFMAGLRYLLEGIGTHTGTGLAPGRDSGRQP